MNKIIVASVKDFVFFSVIIILLVFGLGKLYQWRDTQKVESVTMPKIVYSDLDYMGNYTITAYDSDKACTGNDKGDKGYGITAWGTVATAHRTVAASKDIPFGTVLLIGGEKYIVEDRGGAIGEGHIDIYFDTHAEALSFGKQLKDVYMEVQ